MLRRSQGLLVVKACLVAASVVLPVARCNAAEPIRVAIYADAGIAPKGPPNLERCLSKEAGFTTERVTAGEIRDGKLKDFDIVVFPGGSGSKQGGALGDEGRTAVKKFVEDGRGYLGICAGAYLASADYSWSLHLLDAKVLDRKHWARGNGDVELSLTADAKKFLQADSDAVTVRYAQGPLLAPADKPDIPDYETLATYKTEIAKNGAPSGVMLGTTAAARGTYGAGRVFCYSPHPEAYGNLDHYIQAAVRWAAKK
jgi:putative intracellular protease/amidase